MFERYGRVICSAVFTWPSWGRAGQSRHGIYKRGPPDGGQDGPADSTDRNRFLFHSGLSFLKTLVSLFQQPYSWAVVNSSGQYDPRAVERLNRMYQSRSILFTSEIFANFQGEDWPDATEVPVEGRVMQRTQV